MPQIFLLFNYNTKMKESKQKKNTVHAMASCTYCISCF